MAGLKSVAKLAGSAMSYGERVGCGAAPEITAADVAHALGTIIDIEPAIAIRAVWAGDRAAQFKLEKLILNLVYETAKNKRWQYRDKSQLNRLALLCLELAIKPQLCSSCKGRGFILQTENSPQEKCGVCDGSGVGGYSDSRMANELGIDRMGWTRLWEERYKQVTEVIIGWLTVARKRIYNRLSSE